MTVGLKHKGFRLWYDLMFYSNGFNSKRFIARRETFGLLVYDKKRAKIFIAKGVYSLDGIDKLVFADEKGERTRIEVSEVTLINSNLDLPKDFLFSPTYVEIYPIMNCNERCFFCYVGNSLTHRRMEMSGDIATATANRIGESGVLTTSILGGEPFLYNRLEKLAVNLHDNNTKVSVSTNGTVHNYELFKKLIKIEVGFNVSFHSHIPEIQNKIVKNSIGYNKTVATLKFLLNNTSTEYINVSIVANSLNYEKIPDTIRFLHEIGIDSVSIYHAQGAGFSVTNNLSRLGYFAWLEMMKEAISIGKELGVNVRSVTNYPFFVEKELGFSTDLGLSNFLYGTGDGRRTLYINYDGCIYPTSYNFPDNRLLLGNVIRDSILDIWQNSVILNYIRNASVPKDCKACRFFDICRGGPITNYDLSKYLGHKRIEPNCPIHSKNCIE